MRKEVRGQERRERSDEREDLAVWIARSNPVGLDPRLKIAQPRFGIAYITGASSTDSRLVESFQELLPQLPLTHALIAGLPKM